MHRSSICLALAGVLGVMVLHSVAAQGADAGPPPSDSRLRVVDYDPGRVVTIPIVKGVATRIQFAPSEKIVSAAPGFSADCADEASLWCITAPTGGSEIYVKAKSRAKESNNLEVRTDRRSYSFDLVLRPEFKRERDAMFRVSFRYPDDEAKLRAEEEARTAEAARQLEAAKPRNWAYSMEASPSSQVITPARVYDDGKFVHLEFTAGRPMPEVFAVEADGTESLVPSHVERDTLVVQRLYKKLMLRSGKNVVAIVNDAFEPAATAPATPTDNPITRFFRRAFKAQP